MMCESAASGDWSGIQLAGFKIQCTPRRVLESRPQVVGMLFESIPPGMDMSECSLRPISNSHVSSKETEWPRIGQLSHWQKQILFLIIARRPRIMLRSWRRPKHQTKTENGFNPWAGRCECTNWPAGFELIPEPFSCKSNPRRQRLGLHAPQQIRDPA